MLFFQDVQQNLFFLNKKVLLAFFYERNQFFSFILNFPIFHFKLKNKIDLSLNFFDDVSFEQQIVRKKIFFTVIFVSISKTLKSLEVVWDYFRGKNDDWNTENRSWRVFKI